MNGKPIARVPSGSPTRVSPPSQNSGSVTTHVVCLLRNTLKTIVVRLLHLIPRCLSLRLLRASETVQKRRPTPCTRGAGGLHVLPSAAFRGRSSAPRAGPRFSNSGKATLLGMNGSTSHLVALGHLQLVPSRELFGRISVLSVSVQATCSVVIYR